ncbi:MAG: SDR family NAD(P)-dependent oxidoreductase, partial [Gammaproteobacteria bacterium]|nr:SDR family NAD(P)-dependent oxidoreductase [Gammaproteobacteria bacterium]
QGVHFGNPGSLPARSIAFMFPGQGSQRVGMVGEVSWGYPGARRLWEVADGALAGHLPRPLSRHVYPGTDGGADTDVLLKETDVAQPAMGVADAVVGHVLADLGVEPDMCVGHSYGEYAALHVAAALGFEDMVVLSRERGRAIGDAGRGSPGAMLALGAPGAMVERLITESGGTVIANLNGPMQTVVSGRVEDIEVLRARFAEQGVRATRLNVATAFHSPLVESAQGPLRGALGRVRLSTPKVPVYANTTGEPHSADPESIREALVDHLTMPVRFADCIANMHRDGARIFLEVGPGNVLSSLAANILQGTDAVAIPVDHRDGWFGLLNAAARLFAMGVSRPAERLRELFGGGVRPTREQHPPGRSAGGRKYPGDRFLGTLADAAVIRHQRLMRLFVESEAAAMTRFLRAAGLGETASLRVEHRQVPPPAGVDPLPQGQPPAPTRHAGAASASAGRREATGTLAGTDALERLQRMVADLTGFPSDMLEPDLDLEADLGIDSIKRVEILVEAQDRFPGFADTLDDEGTTAFSRLTTLARMAEFLESATSGTGGGDSEDARAARDVVARRNILPERDGADPVRDERAPARRAPRLVPAAASRRRGLGAGNVVVAGDCRGIAQALARKLPELVPLVLDGGRVGSNAAGTRLRELDSAAGYIHLGMLSAGPSTLEQLRKRSELARRDLLGFAANLKAMAALLRSSGGFVIVAAPFGPSSGGGDGAPDIDPLAGGHLGLLKSVAREWPEVRCRAVDLGAYVDVDAAVGILVNEMGCDDGAVEVAYRDGRRHAVVLSDSHPVAGPSAGPLREGDVVLATGGARGITGEVAVAIAERWRPRLVLVGSTVLEDENPRYGGFSDMAGLKREIGTVLDESGETLNAARVEREYRTVVRRREIRRNLRRLRDAGAEAEYVVADVGDRAAFGRVLADVRQRYGRIDAVVHGAGIREDKLLVDKDMESFDRVLRPKVDGALALLERLDLDSLKLLFFFSSTAASYGSAGQSDYAAANETLNALARWLGGRTPARVVSIGWGPWAPGVGMVDESLARRLQRRGVATIPLRQGIEAFLYELAAGAKGDAEVVYE